VRAPAAIQEARNDQERAEAGPAGPRFTQRTADHGAGRPARPALGIVWELRENPLTFRALQQACGGLSPSVLNQRLGELRATLLVELKPEGYALTALGGELLTQLMPLTGWAEKWAKAIR
jgi:hypothetical protein